MYSGYLNITHSKKQMHYVGVLSKNNPVTDPILIMLGGGRGCSALVGYALENGPYTFDEISSPNTLAPNRYSWNNNATVIYLETPVGTGYSSCGEASECQYNDTSAAKDNLHAVLALLRDKFVMLQDNNIWLVGNYYGGIEVPYLMNELDMWIEETKKVNATAWVPKLRGQIINNGLTDWKYDGLPAFFEMSYYHGLIDDELFDFGHKCNFSYIPVLGEVDLPPGCKKSLETFRKYISPVNEWDIYGKCYKN